MTQPLKVGSSCVHRAGCCWLSAGEGTLSALLGSQLPSPLPSSLEETKEKQRVGVSFLACSVSFLNKQPNSSHTALTAHICQSSEHFGGEVIRNSRSGIMHPRMHLAHVYPALTMCLTDCKDLGAREMWLYLPIQFRGLVGESALTDI